MYDGMHVCLRPVLLPQHFLTVVDRNLAEEEEDVHATKKKSVVAGGNEAETDNNIFPIGMVNDGRIELVVELVELRALAKVASKAKKERDRIEISARSEGDGCLHVSNPFSKDIKEVAIMEAKWNDIYDLETAFNSDSKKEGVDDSKKLGGGAAAAAPAPSRGNKLLGLGSPRDNGGVGRLKSPFLGGDKSPRAPAFKSKEEQTEAGKVLIGDYDYETQKFTKPVPYSAKREGWLARFEAGKLTSKDALYEAARQAKAQGASGAVIFAPTEDFRILQVGPQDPVPVLPMVYANKKGLKALTEKGARVVRATKGGSGSRNQLGNDLAAAVPKRGAMGSQRRSVCSNSVCSTARRSMVGQNIAHMYNIISEMEKLKDKMRRQRKQNQNAPNLDILDASDSDAGSEVSETESAKMRRLRHVDMEKQKAEAAAAAQYDLEHNGGAAKKKFKWEVKGAQYIMPTSTGGVMNIDYGAGAERVKLKGNMVQKIKRDSQGNVVTDGNNADMIGRTKDAKEL